VIYKECGCCSPRWAVEPEKEEAEEEEEEEEFFSINRKLTTVKVALIVIKIICA
jgi:hypothetical protein